MEGTFLHKTLLLAIVVQLGTDWSIYKKECAPYYGKVLEIIKACEYPINRTVLVGGYHTVTRGRHIYQESEEYVHKLALWFMEEGFVVRLKIAGFEEHREAQYTADKQFAYLSASKYYTPSAGGYSHLAGLIVKYKGNHVIGGIWSHHDEMPRECEEGGSEGSWILVLLICIVLTLSLVIFAIFCFLFSRGNCGKGAL